MNTNTYTYIGKGKVYLAPYTNGNRLLPVANCSKLSLAVAVDTKDMRNYMVPGGGTYKSSTSIKGVDLSADLMEYTPENLAFALRGSSSEVSSATVTDEEIEAYKGALAPFAFQPNTANTVTVKNEAGSTTYVKDTDYVLTTAGIRILSSGAITNDQTLKVSYTKNPGYIIQALISSSADYRLYFEGLNEAESGKPLDIDIHKINFTPTAALELIGDDFGKITIKGSVLTDISISGAGLSQYFTLKAANEVSVATATPTPSPSPSPTPTPTPSA